MQFITIQNKAGKTIAINPRQITCIFYAATGEVVVSLADFSVHTQFTDLLAATRYIEQALHDRQLAGHRDRDIEDLWRTWGDI